MRVLAIFAVGDTVYWLGLERWFWALFSHPVPSVSNFSVWHSIKKASKIEPVCDSLQTGHVFFDVVELGDLGGTVAQEVGYLAGG